MGCAQNAVINRAAFMSSRPHYTSGTVDGVWINGESVSGRC